MDGSAPASSKVAAAVGLLRFWREGIELDDLAARVEALEKAPPQRQQPERTDRCVLQARTPGAWGVGRRRSMGGSGAGSMFAGAVAGTGTGRRRERRRVRASI